MKKLQSGFTLVELIVVIVLLGILGVTALGKFQDLSGDAEQAALEGIAAELSAAASINYAKSLIGDGSTHELGIGVLAADGIAQIDTTGTASCTEAGGFENLITGDSIPDVNGNAVSISAGAAACAGNAGDTYTCTLTLANSTATADFTVICTE